MCSQFGFEYLRCQWFCFWRPLLHRICTKLCMSAAFLSQWQPVNFLREEISQVGNLIKIIISYVPCFNKVGFNQTIFIFLCHRLHRSSYSINFFTMVTQNWIRMTTLGEHNILISGSVAPGLCAFKAAVMWLDQLMQNIHKNRFNILWICEMYGFSLFQIHDSPWYIWL